MDYFDDFFNSPNNQNNELQVLIYQILSNFGFSDHDVYIRHRPGEEHCMTYIYVIRPERVKH